MGKKATKATRKFVAKGQLKKTLQVRRKQQSVAKRIRGRKGGKGPSQKVEEEEEEEDEFNGVSQKQ